MTGHLTIEHYFCRLVHRPVEDSVIAGLIAKADKDKVKEARLREIAARKHAEMQESSSSGSQAAAPSGDSSRVIPERLETNMEADICDNKETRSETSLSGQEAMEVDTAASVMSVSTGDASDSNAICNSGQSSVRSQNPVPASGQSSIEQLRSMNIPGVEIFTPDDFNDLPPDQQRVNHVDSYTHCFLKLLFYSRNGHIHVVHNCSSFKYLRQQNFVCEM